MTEGLRTRRSLAIVLAVALPLLALRLLTPYELQETDQGKQAQYALDVFANGNWLAPSCLGDPATKPPLYTWLAAGLSHCMGTIDELTIRVPTVLAALGLVLVTWDIARVLAGPRVAAAAGVALATSHHFIHVSGVVRTDGLLAFLLAAQVLVHVRSLAHPRMPARAVALSCALAAAACLTKGPSGLLSCGVVALHLAATGRARRAWRAAAVPALAGLAAFAVWFTAAADAHPNVYETMVDRETATHLVREGWPNPAYYLLHMPLRLLPWTALLAPAVWLAARAFRRRREEPVPPLVSLSLAWLAVHFAFYSLIPHQRPDLIYGAEPAAMLLVAGLVEHTFPAWAPLAAAALATVAAAVAATPLAPYLQGHELAPWAGPAAAAILVSGAVAALALRRHGAPAAATFAALAAGGVADSFLDTAGDAARNARISYVDFAATARAESARTGLPIVAVGFRTTAPLFDLGITQRPGPADALAPGLRALVVTVPPSRAAVRRVLGKERVVARHAAPGPSRPTLLLLAFP
jgi:4-amino-4-deoxy-L-arabinose transferase-like glycosyltransferase